MQHAMRKDNYQDRLASLALPQLLCLVRYPGACSEDSMRCRKRVQAALRPQKNTDTEDLPDRHAFRGRDSALSGSKAQEPPYCASCADPSAEKGGEAALPQGGLFHAPALSAQRADVDIKACLDIIF